MVIALIQLLLFLGLGLLSGVLEHTFIKWAHRHSWAPIRSFVVFGLIPIAIWAASLSPLWWVSFATKELRAVALSIWIVGLLSGRRISGATNTSN